MITRRLALATVLAALGIPVAANAATWSPVTGATGVLNSVATVRAPDGVLHLVWARTTPGATTTDVMHVPISADGVLGSQSTIAAGFAAASDPAIVNTPGGGLEAFFGGIQCTSSGCPLGLFNSTSRDGGASWTTPTLLLNADQVEGTLTVSAVTLPDGTPFETWWQGLGTWVHRGIDPATLDYDYQGAMNAGCCGYYSNLAADGSGHLQIAWDSNASGFPGVWTRPVDPATGAPSGSAQLMPGSVTTYNGTPQSAQMIGQTPIVAVPGQSDKYYIAYPAGYPMTTKVLLWRVGDANPVTVVDEQQEHNAVALAADSSGRLWVFWSGVSSSGPHVFARRYSAAGAEPAIDLGAPGGSLGLVYSLDGSVAPNGDPEALALVGHSDGTFATYYARGPQTGSVPPPVLGKAVDAAVVSGQVLIKLPPGHQASDALAKGHGFVRLTKPRQLPVGTQVDSRAGKLKLVAATGKQGKTQTGTFGGALFDVGQSRTGIQKGLTTLSLIDDAFPGAPSFKSCTGKAAALTGHIASKHPSKQVLQTLRASDNHGSFRTRGRFSAGTVRGTVWGTVDRCDGTVTWVSRGSVSVHDFGARKTVIVHAGQRYLARARR